MLDRKAQSRVISSLIDSLIFASITANFVASAINKSSGSAFGNLGIMACFIRPLWFFRPQVESRYFVYWANIFAVVMLLTGMASIVGSVCGAIVLGLATWEESARLRPAITIKPKPSPRDDLDW